MALRSSCLWRPQLEVWETQDYFQMLTEHAIRGLMLLGTPDPYTVLAGDPQRKPPMAKLFSCCFGAQETAGSWEVRAGCVYARVCALHMCAPTHTTCERLRLELEYP